MQSEWVQLIYLQKAMLNLRAKWEVKFEIFHKPFEIKKDIMLLEAFNILRQSFQYKYLYFVHKYFSIF